MPVTHETRSAEPGLTSESKFQLRCPRCHGQIGSIGISDNAYLCTRCPFKITCERGVWKALLPEREAYFARFVEDYEFIRAREGRGSKDAKYYLALPDRDISGRNRGQWLIRARTFHYIESQILPHIGSRLNARLRVLDLGAGNGWMSYRLTRQGHSAVAVDLITNEQDGLGAAEHYASHLPFLFPRIQAELDNIPFADHQFDVAIFNASFHYSECYEKTLGEALRCTRPGGTVLIADTAWYPDEESGKRMLSERRAGFQKRFGFPSDEIHSMEYLTDERLQRLEQRFGIHWQTYAPYYGLRWQLRPWLAKLRNARTPSQFRIYSARVVR
jgi:ubiquinone/menaquinone biosynthesis C-methylase UbiE